MNFWIKVDEFLRTPMEVPAIFSRFHFLFLGLTVACSVLVCLFHQKNRPERVRRFIFWVGIGAILFEIYKQYVLNFSIVAGRVVYSPCWDAFPFQFCYLPLYLNLLFALTKEGRLHDAVAAFLATFSLGAGLLVVIYASTVFTDVVGLNWQTMLCHGAMVVSGVYLLSSGYVKLEHKSILKALPVFYTCVFLATVLNEVAYYTDFTSGQYFNMFFISRHYDSSFLPFSSILPFTIPSSVIFFVYVLGFPLAAYSILLIAMRIKKCFDCCKAKKELL